MWRDDRLALETVLALALFLKALEMNAVLGANALVLALFKAATVSNNDKQQAKEADRMALF